MKISYGKNERRYYRELMPGDVFGIGESLYMKTDQEAQAVELSTGGHRTVTSNDKVIWYPEAVMQANGPELQ